MVRLKRFAAVWSVVVAGTGAQGVVPLMAGLDGGAFHGVMAFCDWCVAQPSPVELDRPEKVRKALYGYLVGKRGLAPEEVVGALFGEALAGAKLADAGEL